MMLSTKARYAVMAMVYLAAKDENGKPVSLSQIAESQNISLSFLEQIFILLRGSGLVKSVRGPGGGYSLARGSEIITVSDVIMAVEEPIKMTRCGEKTSAGCLHDKSRCLTHDLWEGLGEMIHEYFRNVSLKDVCERRVVRKGAVFPANQPLNMQEKIMEFAVGK